MYKIISLYLGSFLFSGLLCGMANDSIPPPIFVNQTYGPLFAAQDTFYFSENFVDTIYGEEWRRIYKNVALVSEPNGPNDQFPVVGYTRKEGARIYFIYGGLETYRPGQFFREGLMYDFGLSSGDTVNALSVYDDFDPLDTHWTYRADSVEYMDCVFGDSIKVQYMSAFDNYPDTSRALYKTIWIEELGDVLHPYPPYQCISFSHCEDIVEFNRYLYQGEAYDLWQEYDNTSGIPCQAIKPVSSATPEVKMAAIKIMPNPTMAGNTLRISTTDFQPQQANLVGLADGRLVAQWHFGPGSSFNLLVPDEVVAGAYVVVMTDGAGQMMREKIIIR